MARSRSPSASSHSQDRKRKRSASTDSENRERAARRRDDENAVEFKRGGGGDRVTEAAQAAQKDENVAAAPSASGAAPIAADKAKAALAATRTGGVYIPPFKLAQMLREVEDKSSPAYQRLTWDALRKSINGLINKVNAANIRNILPEVFSENLIRGRGLFCRSIMKSQMASPTFSPVYAALVAVVNTKFPEIGELLLHRIVLQFKRAFKRNDKPVCLAACTFIAHLVNQQVVHELLALEIIILLLEAPSDDSVEVAVGFTKEVGAALTDLAPAAVNTIFDRFRAVLTDGAIDTRTKYIIEGLVAVRRQKFPNNPAIPEGLDLVETEDQITHEIGLDDDLQPQIALDVFKADTEYQKHEDEYEAIKRELLGEDEEEGSQGDGDDDDDEHEGGSEDDDEQQQPAAGNGVIQDMTETNLVNLRRTIYLTIMSSIDFEESGHKLSKINIPAGYESEIPTMLIECCSQEKTYMRYYGFLSQRFCYINRAYQEVFEDCFVKQYRMVHRLETNKLRNVATLFAHLLATDAISWAVLEEVRITEEATTSSSRIFIKVLFQQLSETMGLADLNTRLQDPQCAEWFSNIFPGDNARNMRFSINFFTSIGLGGLTDVMRERLRSLALLQNVAAQQEAGNSSDASTNSDAGSSSSDSSSSDSSDSDSSDSSSSDSSDSSGDSGSSATTEPPARKRQGHTGKHASNGRRSRGEDDLPPPPPRNHNGDARRADRHRREYDRDRRADARRPVGEDRRRRESPRRDDRRGSPDRRRDRDGADRRSNRGNGEERRRDRGERRRADS